MNADFNGKTAVVAGTDPAGQSVALALARAGARVFACGGQLGELEALAWKEGLSIQTKKLAIADGGDLPAFLREAGEAQGAIHVLVCNAQAAPVRKPVTQVTPEEWSAALDGSLRADWKAAAAAVPYLERAEGAALVFLTTAARRDRLDGVRAVCAAGVESMTKTLASELASRHIRVNAVAVGPQGEQAAGAVLFLAGGAASYCTGALLEAGTGSIEEVEA